MKHYLLGIALLFGAASSPAMAWRNTYGAIAISPSTGARGAAWNRWNVIDAQLGARLNCGVADCFVAVTVSNACASVAVGYGGRYGWAIRGNAPLAAQGALWNCAARTSNCYTTATICSAPF